MNSVPVEPRLTEYLYRKAALAGVPISGTFELTPVCNMACKMCYVRMTRQEQQAIAPLRTAEEWIQLGRQAKEAGMLYLLLTGGEPFVHPQFREILESLHRLGLLISINSNGTLIDEKTVQWLQAAPPVRINISLYGTDDETYQKLCGQADGFTRVSEAIRLLKQAGIPVKLSCSVTPHNAHQLPAIFDLAEKWGLPLQAAAYLFPPVRRDKTMTGQNDRLSPRQAALCAAYAEYRTLGREAFLAAGSRLVLPGEGDDDCASVGEGIGCRAGKCSFWVTWQGQMMPCGMFPEAGGPNVFTQSFSESWQAVRGAAAAVRLPAPCAGCAMKQNCRACAAMVITESGSFGTVPRYRCEMSHAYPGAYGEIASKIKEGSV